MTRLAAPAMLVAARLSLGPAQGPIPVTRAAADQHQLAGPAVMMPFAATPRTVPMQVVTTIVHRRHQPAASAQIVALPAKLNVRAAAIPHRVLAGYVNAVRLTDTADPQCKLRWQVLAGIGFIESDHARSGGSGRADWNGVANPPIFGPLLDGSGGFTRMPDTDNGAIDGNRQWDRAVGPMQFMPSTWAVYAADGNHDGIRDPQQIDDATLAASDYLCTTGPDLNRPRGLIRAVHAYNHSYPYVRAVLTVAAHYMNINPAKLGIDGLPGAHSRRFGLTVLPPTVSSHRSASTSSPSSPPATPPVSPSPSPTASPSPTPPALPTPTKTWVPSPSPTATLPTPRHPV